MYCCLGHLMPPYVFAAVLLTKVISGIVLLSVVTLSRVQFTPNETLPIHTEPGFTLMLLAGRITFLLIHVCPECVMTLVYCMHCTTSSGVCTP